jgi:hypothetical protein
MITQQNAVLQLLVIVSAGADAVEGEETSQKPTLRMS